MTDLELRLALGPLALDPVARLVALRERAAAHLPTHPFYARSFEHDPWGTTQALDRMLTAISDAGFDPSHQAHPALAEHARLATLTALARDPLPPADPERLTRIERALATNRTAIYDGLELAEPATRWPARWRRVFAALAAHSPITHLAPPTPTAPETTDLGRLQRALASLPFTPLVGDGTVALVQATTLDPLADIVAALIGSLDEARVAILRTTEIAPLEAALAAHHRPRLGGARVPGVPLAGAWLPLVLGLARAPFDPEAAVDLILLPGNELGPDHAEKLARSLGESPGLAGQNFLRDLARAREAKPEATARLDTWLSPLATLDATSLAERARLVDETLARRLRAQTTRQRLSADTVAHPAAADALALTRDALDALVRALPRVGALDPEPLDGLLRTFGEVSAQSISRLESGSLRRLDDPAALLGEVDTLVWWGFVDPGPLPPSPFRAAERAALDLDAPVTALADRRAAWHAAILRTRERLVLALPGYIAGEPQAIHPLWSELRGALGWTESRDERVVRFDPSAVTQTTLTPVARVPARHTWRVTHPIERFVKGRVTALETLLTCPLHYLLRDRAGLRERAYGQLAEGPLLYGKLGHRLIERLVQGDRFDADDAVLERETLALIGDEGAQLLRPGRAAERRAVVRTLLRMVAALRRFIADEGASLDAVERPITVQLGETTIEGRLDLLLRTRDGAPFVLDLKWSAKKPGSALRDGRALQLSAYVRSHGDERAAGAYFGISDGHVARAPAAAFSATWARAERTLTSLEGALAEGRVPVVGVPDAPTLGELLAMSDAHTPDLRTACDYCRMGLICGREPKVSA